jgi:hypothetical protein
VFISYIFEIYCLFGENILIKGFFVLNIFWLFSRIDLNIIFLWSLFNEFSSVILGISIKKPFIYFSCIIISPSNIIYTLFNNINVLLFFYYIYKYNYFLYIYYI